MDQNDVLNSLFLALENHDIEATTEILTSSDWIDENTVFDSIPPNYKMFGKAPFPLLNVSSSFNFLEGTQFLLENDLYADCTDENNNSPLHCAASCGSVEIMDLLLSEYSCDPTPRNKNKDLPIHIAATYNQNDAVSFLVEKKINSVEAKNNLGKTVLAIAVENDNVNLAEYLINDCNSDVKTVDNEKNTLLHIALENESFDALAYLLSLEIINIDSINLKGITPLHISAMKGNFDIFKSLLSYNACPLILDKKNRSIVHYSIKSSCYEIFDYIIQNKLTYPFQIDANNFTPFHYAAASPDIRFLTNLASIEPEINKTSLINDAKCGFAPLHIACKHKLYENVNFIILHELSDPLVENCYNQNALHIAERSSNFKLFLLEGNVYDISICDQDGVFILFFN